MGNQRKKLEVQQDLQRRRDLPVVDGIYRHYNGGLYIVKSVSIMEDTCAIMVTYRSNATGCFWSRTLEDWESKVAKPGAANPDPGATKELVLRFSREGS